MFQNIFSSPRRISMGLSVLRFLKMVLGLVVLYLSILYFGTSMERDAWVIAIGTYSVIIQSVYSPINDTFRTRFIYLKSSLGEKSVIESVNSLISIFWISFLVIGVCIFICRHPLTRIIAPGFNDTGSLFLISLMLWLLPYFVFQQMVNITQALLNTYESYFYPDIISLLASIINILFIVLFAQSIGIYALVIATSINYGLLILVLCCLLHRKVPDFSIFPHLGLKKAVPFLTFSLPVYLAMFTVQMYAMVERATCSKFGEGAVSLYDYAHQIMNLPNVVFSSIVPIVLTPLLSKYHIDGMGQAFSSEYRKFMRMLLVFTIIVGEVMIVNRCDISILFFNKNNVDFENLEIALGITIFFVIVNLICGQALIAQSRIKQYVTGIVLGNVLSILACLSLNSLFPLYAIAICYIIGQIVSMVILLHFLQIEEKGKSLSDIGFLLLIFIGTCCLALFASSQVHQEGGKMAAIINILTFSTCEILLIGGLYFTFFKEERKTLLNFIHSKH